MLQRDYFIRLIEEFQAAIRKFLEKEEDDRNDAAMKDLYRQYVGPYDVVRNLSFDELLAYCEEQWLPEQRMERLNFAAELLYAEASYKANPLRAMLLEKAFKVYSYLDAHSGVMSLDRRQKMSQIQQEVGKLG
ncbi:MAG: hypothetical protein I3J02_06490 [Prevotella sp.]|nr:hypothetical protein [Prevotella sp.]